MSVKTVKWSSAILNVILKFEVSVASKAWSITEMSKQDQ